MLYSSTFFAALFASAFSASAYTQDALNDQVVNLPGAENLDLSFNQFSGYLTVGGTKHLHYWMVESMGDPTTDPIAFWTNGGPGCSGLLGFLTEQGPFRPTKDLTLEMNDFAWNKVSTMVFIEQPCGVGFSYSDNPSKDYQTGDTQAAKDNYALLQAFFQRFPEYKSNGLYISSESYGGHYMPQLAKEIVDQNTKGKLPKLNFKGFAVGNPYTDDYSGTGAMLQTYWGHQLVAKPVWDTYQTNCIDKGDFSSGKCLDLQNTVNAQAGSVNPYAVDFPICTSDAVAAQGRAQRTWFLNHMLKAQGGEQHMRNMGVPSASSYEPCESNYAVDYLNQAEVKAALHVNSAVEWGECSDTINYEFGANSTAPLYNYLVDGGYGLDILVYSGDDDSVCATVGTQNWLWDLGYKYSQKDFWTEWLVGGQPAGHLTQFAKTGLSFLTVHGAGHEVPAYKPQYALELWSKYLQGDLTNA